MARISGVDLPNNKRIEIALTYIYGIGRTSATKIIEKIKIDPDLRAKNLSDEQISQIQSRGNHRERTRKLGPNRAFDCSDPTGLVPALISKKEWSRVRCCGDTGNRRLNRTIATQ